ncbi:MAG TPA: helix-turn-helix transcriptional regulator [Tenuifilaceae bacterium]|mgnify:CR=1 FL=1|nr:helix-turn-helix transcriptional regulator [Tenuifilaceae bacterium]HPE18265.1 helix-turn-helix transcriptional regulator [Tenuifilaceae bacterium]HPJ45258.1 helix-turn-helix transcriptional regulator [Tenuifilaceae bacterium]HPQ33379.1 helix-turn-helix transcriptional regulator [Tenuifilaceae bacterium]HRX67536.1 helix-turn-helix transcriptional regulator [Tenuifilaceae bacterium]
MKERLQKIMSVENLSSAKFAEIIGVQRSSVSHFLSGRNNPSYDVITSIIENFPKINPDWLITGKGDMYRKAIQTSIFDQISNNKIEENISPIKKTIQQKTPTSGKAIENQIFEKEVERVIVFFTDKTFIEYKPD